MNNELEEALSDLEKLETHRIEYKEGFELGFTKTMPFKSTKEFKIIKQSLLKAQEQEEIVKEYDLQPYELREALLLYAMYKGEYKGNPLPKLKQALEQEKENAKYKQLEEQLGCPLEVVFKALTNGIYTKENILNIELELFEVRGIEKKGLGVISNFCGYAECDFTCYYSDYKKTWWLRKDKSE